VYKQPCKFTIWKGLFAIGAKGTPVLTELDAACEITGETGQLPAVIDTIVYRAGTGYGRKKCAQIV
jgi:hypothetical protein